MLGELDVSTVMCPKQSTTYDQRTGTIRHTRSGLSGRRKMTLIGLMLCVTIVMPFVCLSMLQPESETDSKKEQRALRRLVRSLNSIQAKHEQMVRTKQKAAVDVVDELLPWLPKNNTLPNFFFGKRNEDNRKTYENANLVFLHQPRAAGTVMLNCLRNVSLENNLPMSPLMNIDNLFLWESGDSESNLFREDIKIHRGRYGFGLCEKLKTPCSYFLIMRDPFERAVSSYHYCKSALGDELCGAINANKVTLRKWILEQGSILFNQILFSSKFCSDSNNTFPFLPKNGDDLINIHNLPCWYKEKVILEKLLDPDERNLVTSYVVSNFNRWFSVIGLFDNLKESLKLFEHVFNLPFTKCNYLKDSETHIDSRILTNNVHSPNSRQNAWFNPEEEDPEYLKNDVYIRDALMPDYAIYKEAKKIFSIQQQFLFNSLRS